MTEPGSGRERRPANVPADWLTRQQVEVRLGLTPTRLRKYVTELASQFPEDIVDLGPSRPAYLSPLIVAAIAELHNSTESVERVTGYLNRTEAVEKIGCTNWDFPGLVKENPPVVADGDMRLLRNLNSQIFPYYALAYIERLVSAYALQQANKPRGQRGSAARPIGTKRGPTVHPMADVLQRRTVVEAGLVELSDDQRASYHQRVNETIGRLQFIERRFQQDPAFKQLLQQLYMADGALTKAAPMPRGLDRLLERAEGYIHRDEE